MLKQLLSNKYSLLVLLLLAMMPSAVTAIYYSFHDHWCDYWPTFNYFVGYEYGFGGRKLIGTLLGPLMPEAVTAKHIRLFVLPANLLMLFGTAWVVWRSLRGMERRAMPVAMLLALYAAGPFSMFAYVATHLSVCFMETYQLVLVLAWLALYVRHRGRWYYYLATFAVSILGCLVHHTFCCTLFPLMLSLMLFDAFEGGRLQRARAAIYGADVLLMLGLFVALWQLSGMNIDLDTLYDRIAARANQDVLPDRDGLRMLYFLSNAENSSGALTAERMTQFGVELLMLLPLLAALASPWVIAARRASLSHGSGVGGEALRYYLPLAAQLLVVPVFFMATDYSRWWVCWTFSMAMLPMAAAATGDSGMAHALQTLWQWTKRHWWLPLLVGIYLLQLHNSNRQFFDGMKESVDLIEFIGSFFK